MIGSRNLEARPVVSAIAIPRSLIPVTPFYYIPSVGPRGPVTAIRRQRRGESLSLSGLGVGGRTQLERRTEERKAGARSDLAPGRVGSSGKFNGLNGDISASFKARPNSSGRVRQSG